jgi:hypothetical protein
LESPTERFNRLICSIPIGGKAASVADQGVLSGFSRNFPFERDMAENSSQRREDFRASRAPLTYESS